MACGGTFGEIHTADQLAHGQVLVQLIVGERADLLRGGAIEEILTRGGCLGIGAVDVVGEVDLQWDVSQLRWQDFTNRLLGKRLAAFAKQISRVGIEPGAFVGQFPVDFAPEKLLPSLPEGPLSRVVALWPAGDIDQQRPFGELLILVEVLQRVAGKQVLFAGTKQVFQGLVDRPHGAMEIDRAKQLAPGLPKSHQGIHAPVVDRQSPFAKKCVAKQSLEIEGPCAVARHVGIAQHEIHVVDGVEPAEQTPQHDQPAGLVGGIIIDWPGDQPGNLVGIDSLAVRQTAVGAGTN